MHNSSHEKKLFNRPATFDVISGKTLTKLAALIMEEIGRKLSIKMIVVWFAESFGIHLSVGLLDCILDSFNIAE